MKNYSLKKVFYSNNNLLNEIAFEIVKKMGKHARMNMGLAFPEEVSILRANTPE